MTTIDLLRSNVNLVCLLYLYPRGNRYLLYTRIRSRVEKLFFFLSSFRRVFLALDSAIRMMESIERI